MNATRLAAAFLVAPFVPGLVVAFLNGMPGDALSAAWGLAPYACVGELLFGVPAFVFYRRYRLTRLTHYVIGGFLGPVVISLLWGALGNEPMAQWLGAGAWFGLTTAPAAALFWAIAVRQPRP